MKSNFIHVCFVIDESGSMTGSESDIIGGFKKTIDEQRAIKDGSCAVSLYKFDDRVTEVYRGKDVNEVEYLDENSYRPGGCTAMNDAIGTAIDNIGTWLNGMKEEDKPEKNLIVIMTDGEENSSREYSIEKVKEMIKHQEDKYNWTFLYLGTDISDASYAKSYGFTNRAFTTKASASMDNVYTTLNASMACYRCTTGSTSDRYAVFDKDLSLSVSSLNESYEEETGNKIANND